MIVVEVHVIVGGATLTVGEVTGSTGWWRYNQLRVVTLY